jgi:tetratricopeptide (TPR) repeat protein
MEFMEREVFQAVQHSVARLASAQVFETSRVMFDLGQSNFQNGNPAIAVALLDRVIGLDDPFFATQALMLLVYIYRGLGNNEKLGETYRKILNLPDSHKASADPAQLGVMLFRSGNIQAARNHYLAALTFNPDDKRLASNYTEFLLIQGEAQECIRRAEKLVTLPSPRFQLVGRLMKGAALFMLGDQKAAEVEFQWIANWVIPAGALPPDFSWDFSDARQIWQRLNSRSARLVIELLDRKLDFVQFCSEWQALHPSAETSLGKS